MSRADGQHASGRSVLLTAFLATLPGPALAQVELLSRALSTADTAGGESVLPSGSYGLPCCAVSATGRYVVFLSNASDLVTGQVDANEGQDVFLRDVTSGATLLVSHSSTSPLRAGNGVSTGATLSADGRYVVFESRATDLVAGASDLNNSPDVFLFDRETGVLSLVSHRAIGSDLSGSGASESPVISADGGYVAFASKAADLVVGQTDTGGQSDVFLFERSTETMRLASHAAGTPTTAGNGASGSPALSGDGTFVAFGSGATDLLAGQTGSGVFLFDRTTGQNTLASHRTGAPTDGVAGSLRGLSQDGRYLVFATVQSLSGPGTDGPGLYRFDRLTDTTVRVAGTSQGYGLGSAVMSADGRWDGLRERR
jgi:Tol biopolymer transport system component